MAVHKIQSAIKGEGDLILCRGIAIGVGKVSRAALYNAEMYGYLVSISGKSEMKISQEVAIFHPKSITQNQLGLTGASFNFFRGM